MEDETTLQSLPGVSKLIARRLMAERPYTNHSDLLRIRGITPEMLTDWEKSGMQILFPEASKYSSSVLLLVIAFCRAIDKGCCNSTGREISFEHV
eukprot:3637753-Rhodomonas_salina.4